MRSIFALQAKEGKNNAYGSFSIEFSTFSNKNFEIPIFTKNSHHWD